MRYLLVILLLITSVITRGHSQDTTQLKALYDRCLDFSESQLDSIYYYSEFIAAESARLQFVKGEVLSLRLKGIYYDLRNDYDKALDYYLQSLTAAQKINGTEYEIAALTDMAMLYSSIKQPRKAKETYLMAAKLSLNTGDLNSLITAYGNLGAIYNQLNLTDSALYFLRAGLQMAEPLKNELDMGVIYNNLGNVYFVKKDYQRALQYFRLNATQHSVNELPASLWFDYLNIADVYIELHQYDSALWYSENALKLGKQLNSKSKESDSYAILAKLYETKGEFRHAYSYQRKWYELDTSLVNEGTNTTIADLQERYNAQKRQRENDILMMELEKQMLYRNTTLYLLIGLLIVAAVLIYSFMLKRKAHKKLQSVNKLIVRQNEKLTELNFEKNALIGVVSHDLATPFASIKLWSQLLLANSESFSADQKKAINRIMDSTQKGDEMIKSILDVEKVEVSQQHISLVELNLTNLINNVIEDFLPHSTAKSIQLRVQAPIAPVLLVSDEHFLTRVFQNLISNAIKFTPEGKNVYVILTEEKEKVNVDVADEGVGIDCDDFPKLFSKYARLSSRPTNGENSNGLGLSIVKRILQELNGTIACKSEIGKGSVFSVTLKK